MKTKFFFKHKRLKGIRVVNARNSKLAPYTSQTFLLPPQFLGIYEKILKKGERGADFSGEIDFSNGWNGAPLAIGAFSKEIHKKVMPGLLNGPTLIRKLIMGDLGIIDGHHRKVEAERGNFRYVPVQLFDMDNKNMVLGTWIKDFEPLTVKEVRSYFKKNEFVPPKATKFQLIGKDGNLYRIMDLQPNVIVPLENLV